MKPLCLVLVCFLGSCSVLHGPTTAAPENPSIPSAPPASLAHTTTDLPPNVGWMIGYSAIDHLQQAGWPQEQIRRVFDNPRTYLMGKMPDGWQSVSAVTFTSDADIEKQFNDHAIPDSVRAIVYDNEHWQFTPLREQQNFASFVKQVAGLVHLHHKILIAAPATDLVQTLDPTRTGDKYDRFLSLGMIRQAATYADVVEIQAQGSESDTTKYTQFVTAAVAQAKSANPKIIVFAGLSTNPNGQHVTGAQLYAAYQATKDSVSGYWLNIPGEGDYCPNCGPAQPNVAIDFLKLVNP